eukprot:364766-Chlamydomonas_euryale.AAC.2
MQATSLLAQSDELRCGRRGPGNTTFSHPAQAPASASIRGVASSTSCQESDHRRSWCERLRTSLGLLRRSAHTVAPAARLCRPRSPLPFGSGCLRRQSARAHGRSPWTPPAWRNTRHWYE